MNKLKYIICFIALTSPIYAQGQHRWSTYTSLLVQNGPFRDFAQSTPEGIYASIFDVWSVGQAAMGVTFGGAYDYTFKNRLKFRMQAQIESAGWISGTIDLGIGARLPISKKAFISFETYFSVSQTGGELKLLNSVTLAEGSKHSYVGLFGFKGRVAIEIPIKQYFIAPFVSYAVYPWFASNIENLHINGFQNGALIDSLQLGIEFGAKF